MSYTTPFMFLPDHEARYLVNDSHKNDRITYVDCLALMHDVLADFGPMAFHSVFNRQEIEHAAADSKSNFAPSADSVKKNVEINMTTALQLHTELTSASRQVTRAVALSYVEEYLNHLFQQYQAIRFEYRRIHPYQPIRRPVLP